MDVSLNEQRQARIVTQWLRRHVANNVRLLNWGKKNIPPDAYIELDGTTSWLEVTSASIGNRGSGINESRELRKNKGPGQFSCLSPDENAINACIVAVRDKANKSSYDNFIGLGILGVELESPFAMTLCCFKSKVEKALRAHLLDESSWGPFSLIVVWHYYASKRRRFGSIRRQQDGCQ